MIRSKVFSGAVFLLLGAISLQAHDEGHRPPSVLPPFGPHGGRYAKMTKHYAEIVVRGKELFVYIIEPDIKYTAEDATEVQAVLSVPGSRQPDRKLRLQKVGNAYRAVWDLPKNTRRAYVIVSCVMDGKKETGRVLYEPRR